MSSDPANGTNATPITEPPGRRKKHWRLVSSLVGYGLIIALALRTIDKERFIAVLSRLGFTDFAIVLGLIACHIGMRALRYHALTLRARPKHYRLLDAVRIFLFGLSASVVTPARAGDVIKAELLHEHGVRRAVGLGIVVIERLLDLLVVTVTIVVSAALLAQKASRPGLQLGAAILFTLLVLGGIGISVRSVRAAVIKVAAGVVSKLTKRVRLSRIEDASHRLFDVWDEVFTSPDTLARYLIVTIAAWLFDFAKLWVLLNAAGVKVDFVNVLFTYPTSLVAGILTILPFSEGVVGVTAVALLSSLSHVDVDTAAAAVGVDRALSTLAPLALYLAFAFSSKTPSPLSRR